MKKTIIAAGIVLVLGGIFIYFQKQSLGGAYIVPTSKITSATVSCGGNLSGATSSLWAAGSYQRIVLTNLQNGTVFFDFGTNNATSTRGYVLASAASSSGSIVDITDPSLLNKGANCVTGDATSSVNVFKVGF